MTIFNEIISALDFAGTDALAPDLDIMTEDDLLASAFPEDVTLAEAGLLDLFAEPLVGGEDV